jgi:glucose-6-phosphate isomerase
MYDMVHFFESARSIWNSKAQRTHVETIIFWHELHCFSFSLWVIASTLSAVFCFQEFVNFNTDAEGMDSVEYSQSCKGKNTVILGFVWTHNNEIVFVTDHGVELFQVQ